jgi:hypothetical protein
MGRSLGLALLALAVACWPSADVASATPPRLATASPIVPPWNPVLSPALTDEPCSPGGNVVVNGPAVIAVGDTLRMWYTCGQCVPDNAIREVRSGDGGRSWRDVGLEVMTPETLTAVTGDTCFAVYSPEVLALGDNLVMWFTGSSGMGGAGLYRAVSTDDGLSWTLDPEAVFPYDPRSNPMVDPTVAHQGDGTFRLAFAHRRQVWTCTSTDAVDWSPPECILLPTAQESSLGGPELLWTPEGWCVWYNVMPRMSEAWCDFGTSRIPVDSFWVAAGYSADGVTWERLPPRFTLPPNPTLGSWDTKAVRDPEVVPCADGIRLFFTGIGCDPDYHDSSNGLGIGVAWLERTWGVRDVGIDVARVTPGVVKARFALCDELACDSLGAFTRSLYWDAAELADGAYTLRAQANDSTEYAWCFEVDATPPRPVIRSPYYAQVVRDTLVVLGAAQDPRFRRFRVELSSLDGARRDTLRASGSPPADSVLATASLRDVPDGEYDVTLTVEDQLGLSGAASARVLVDQVAPWAHEISPREIARDSGGVVFCAAGDARLVIGPHALSGNATVVLEEEPLAGSVPEGIGESLSPAHRVSWEGAMVTGSRPILELKRLAPAPAGAADPIGIYRVAGDGAWTRIGGDAAGDSIATVIEGEGLYVAATGPPEAGGGLGIVSLTPRALSPRASTEGVAIGVRLPRSGRATVRVHNLAGRLVSVVADEAMPAGTSVVRWDGRGPSGAFVDHGIYLVSVEAFGQRASKTVAVLP